MQPIHLESHLGLGQTLSKNNNEIKASIRDTRFILKVQLTMRVAYVSVEVSTKDWVSLDPKPHRTITKI
jgi:hypothetical protein